MELERVCMLEYAQNPLVQANKGENGAPLVSEVAAVAVTSAGGGPSALVVFAVLPGGLCTSIDIIQSFVVNGVVAWIGRDNDRF